MGNAKTKIGSLFVNGIENEYIFQTISKSGDFYEASLLKEWTPYVEKAKCILDIGANIGNHSLYWASHTNATSIFSFEPLPENYLLLSQNIEDNQIGDRVKCLNFAVGDQEGSVELVSLDESNMGTAQFTKSDSNSNIKMTSIDSYREEAGIPPVDFVKIDTEGFEVFVLKGMELTVQAFHPDLWIEVAAETSEEVIAFLQRHDYTIASVHGSNLLCLSHQRHGDINEADVAMLLPEFFQHVERRNQYYALYNKVNARNKEQQEALKEYKAQAQAALVEKQKQLEAASGRYRQALESIGTLKERAENVSAAYKRAQETIVTLKERAENANAAYKRAQETIETLKERAENANAAYKRAQESISTYKEKLQNALDALKDEQIQGKRLLHEKADLLGQLTTAHAMHEQVRALVYTLQYDLSKYDKTIQNKDLQISDQAKQLKEARQAFRDMEVRYREDHLLKCIARVLKAHVGRFAYKRKLGKPLLALYSLARKILRR